MFKQKKTIELTLLMVILLLHLKMHGDHYSVITEDVEAHRIHRDL